MHSYNTILSQFNAFLGIDNWQPSTAYRREYERICINVIPLSLSNEQKKEILRITIVDKLDIYKEYIQNLIDECALNSYFFNYIEKTIITESLIKHDSNPFCRLQKKSLIPQKSLSHSAWRPWRTRIRLWCWTAVRF